MEGPGDILAWRQVMHGTPREGGGVFWDQFKLEACMQGLLKLLVVDWILNTADHFYPPVSPETFSMRVSTLLDVT